MSSLVSKIASILDDIVLGLFLSRNPPRSVCTILLFLSSLVSKIVGDLVVGLFPSRNPPRSLRAILRTRIGLLPVQESCPVLLDQFIQHAIDDMHSVVPIGSFVVLVVQLQHVF